MNYKLIAAGVGLALLTIGGLFLWMKPSAEKQGPPPFLHCPVCDWQIAYVPAMLGKPCPGCGPKGVAKLVPRTQTGPSRGSDVVAGVVVLLVLGQGLFYFLALRTRAAKLAAEEAVPKFIRCQCPTCRRKLKYPLKRAGSAAVCPRCKTDFYVPTEQSMEVAS